MRPRPIYDGPPPSQSKQSFEIPSAREKFEAFREEERAWFEELLAHPHVQEVMNIPEDEPIFVLRAQDISAGDTVDYWLAENQRIVSDDKFQQAVARYKEILEWQNVEPTRAKIPD